MADDNDAQHLAALLHAWDAASRDGCEHLRVKACARCYIEQIETIGDQTVAALRPLLDRHAAAQAAVERIERFCTLLDTAGYNMAGRIVSGRADPEQIRMVLAGGQPWTDYEAAMAARPPGGIDPELLARIGRPMKLGDVIELPGGVTLTAE